MRSRRYKDELLGAQQEFALSVGDLANLVAGFAQHTDMAKMDHIVSEVGGTLRAFPGKGFPSYPPWDLVPAAEEGRTSCRRWAAWPRTAQNPNLLGP